MENKKYAPLGNVTGDGPEYELPPVKKKKANPKRLRQAFRHQVRHIRSMDDAEHWDDTK